MNYIRILGLGLAAAAITGCDRDRDPAPASGPAVLKCAVARVVSGPGDLVPGPVARGTPGDLVIENDKLRAIVQKGGRNWYNISQFGGNIIDALPKAADGSLVGNDNFEEFVLGTNIESVPNYQDVTVAEAGGENPDGSCKRAVVRATAEFDDLMDFVNGSSAIRGISPLQFPPSADDFDLPFRFETDYILEAGKRYVTVTTRLINPTAQQHRIYLVEYLNGSGEVEVFQSGYGFGEAFATAPCNSCNFIAYAGHEGGAGVSYGLIHNNATGQPTAGTTSVSVSGVSVFLYGRDILLVATTPEETQPPRPDSTQPVGPNGPNFVVPANGELALTRYFAVGDGDVASIVDVRNELVPPAGGTGTLQGEVTDASGPVAGAEIAVLTSGSEGFPTGRGPALRVVNHFRTDAQGRFGGTQQAGSYTLRVNVPGRLAATPSNPNVTVAANATTTQNFTVPAASGVQFVVKDAANNPLPAKAQLLGPPDPNDPDGAEPLNQESVLGGQLVVRTGVFGDALADPLPPRVRLAEFAVLDTLSAPVAPGQTGPLAVEPGTYEFSVSAGPRYAEHRGSVTVTAGGIATVEATLVEVVPTPGYVHADFHVHSINSPDSEVTNRERVATYLAEGMDFFTPSDHDIRVDFAPVVAAMGVAGRIATAPSAEVTTFDYGHFNFWPVKLETNSPNDELPNQGHSTAAKIGAGATDWGGQAPLGQDFPCPGNGTPPCANGNYSLSPAEIFASAALDPYHAGETVVRQINHINSHFGDIDGSGLGIDTGNPAGPVSTVDPGDKRLDPAIANHYGDDYHTLEILIGTDGREYQNELLYEENMGDWFNLLNLGRAKVGISNSDTHQRRVTSLHTRNQIAVPAALLSGGRANPAAIAADPHAVGDSVRAGLTTMTNAPLLEVTVTEGANAASLLTTRTHGGIGKPLPSDGTVTVNISVKSPSWAPYDQILVFTNGETERHADEFGRPTAPPRYRICGPGASNDYRLATGGFTRDEVLAVPGNAASKRYQTTKEVSVTSPGGDFWIVVMVRGTQGASPTMWPVVPNDHAPGTDGVVGNADDVGVRALAISNPIYVDVDTANDTWTAPGVRVNSGSKVPPDACPQAMPAP